jgi:hypothetical protein
MTYSLAQLRKAITQRRQAEGFSQPSSAMLSAHLQKHAFMFGELGIDPNALRNLAQKRAAWSKIKARFHPPVGTLNTRDAHGYIHATNKHVGYAYPPEMLQQATSMAGGSQTKDQCSKAGSALRKAKSSQGAIDLNECRWQTTKTVRDARKTKRSSPKPAEGLQQLAKDLVSEPDPEPDFEPPEPEPPPKPKAKPRKTATRITPESAEIKYIFTLVARKLWPQFQRYVKDTRPTFTQKQIAEKWAVAKDMYAKDQKRKADEAEAKKLDRRAKQLDKQSAKATRDAYQAQKKKSQQAARKKGTAGSASKAQRDAIQKVGKVPRKPQKGGADEKKSPSRLYSF